MAGESVVSQEATLAAFLDGMDKGTALSYSPLSGRIPMERRLAAFLAADVVSMQRFLYKEFERNNERLAAACVRYDRLMMDWFVNNPEYGKPRVEVPLEVELEIMGLRALLNHYFPSSYPLDGVSANDDDDDDDG